MIVRLGGLAVAVMMLAGCPVPQIKSGATVTADKLPDKAPDLIKYADEIFAKANAMSDGGTADMENALMALDKAVKADPKSYEAAWKAARAAGWLADELYDVFAPGNDKTKRAHFAQRGAEYAKAAIDLEPKKVEGHYYSGINLGLTATTRTIGAKFMVPSVRDAEKKAMALDSSYDHGGPPRVLGSLYANAPPWPASIGDPDKGVEFLSQSVKLASDFPLNNLLLGEALVAAEKYDEAKKQYQIVLAAQPKPEDTHFLAKWKKVAAKRLEDADKKKASAMNGS
jgi:tetratricopeptide (TPR) repeat protein